MYSRRLCTGINGTTRTNDDKPNQPMDTQFNQKIHKYGQAADQNQLRFIPVIISYASEMHKGIINLLLEQIRLKLQLVDGEVKKSKVQAIMKHCVRSISAAINRSASRNIQIYSSRLPKWSIWNAITNKTSPLPLPVIPLTPPTPFLLRTYSKNSNFKS